MGDLILGGDWLRLVHHLPGRPFGAVAPNRRTIVGTLARNAMAIPNALFLSQIGHDLRTATYAEASRAVRHRAALLVASGLARGDRVGVLGHNSIDFVFAVLAVLEAGGVAVLLNPQDPAARTAAHIEFTECRFLLHDPDCAGFARTCIATERICSFQELDAPSRQQERSVTALSAPTDAALIFFTSGTTGAPKAVVQSHYAVAQNAWSLVGRHRIRPGTRLLCVLPLHHVNGLEFTVFAAMLAGGHTVVCQGFDGLRFWTAVREHGIHITSLVPNLLRLLAERPGLRGEGDVPLRYAVSAAAPLSIEISQRVRERLGLHIVQGYGLSETTNFSCLMPRDLSSADYSRWMLAGRRTSVGPALPGQQVEIHDGQGIAPPKVEGEIVIRGHCVMSGYLHNTAATDEIFRGGWLHTGDLGYSLLDRCGRKYIHVSGRSREIAKRSGAMVSLLELDEVLASIPGVADAGSAAFANVWVDEEIAALVVRQPGSHLTEKSATEQCRRLLPFAAMPKAIEFVEEIPRTASGKIRRAEIAGRFAELRERLFFEKRGPREQAVPTVIPDHQAKGQQP